MTAIRTIPGFAQGLVMGLGLGLVLGLGLPSRVFAQDQKMAPAASLPPPAAGHDRPAAFAAIAPYRYDDVLWENDRTAHRIYGHALEAFEPPSSSGIDAWGKSVRWPFMERQLHSGDQHQFHGEGLDFYDVNTFRGAGGLGVWYDNKLWVSRNYIRARILNPGPVEASFEVDYAPWPVDVDRKVWETRRFTLPMGTNFTRMVSTIGSDTPGRLVIGIGISRHPTTSENGVFTADCATGRFAWWGPEVPGKGAMGIAVLVDPAQIVDVRPDADNYLILIKVMPGQPFVYYAGAAWSRGLDFHDPSSWLSYVRSAPVDFDPAH
ncbi:MAG: DUF4861 family protein [Asticcacaulis sp.]